MGNVRTKGRPTIHSKSLWECSYYTRNWNVALQNYVLTSLLRPVAKTLAVSLVISILPFKSHTNNVPRWCEQKSPQYELCVPQAAFQLSQESFTVRFTGVSNSQTEQEQGDRGTEVNAALI